MFQNRLTFLMYRSLHGNTFSGHLLTLNFEPIMNLSLAERDKKVIWHPFTPQKYMPDPIPIVKGDGAYLTDINGNRYLDAISSWWVTLHGHGNTYIAEKIYEQAKTLEQVIFAGFTHEPAVRLAERLLAILPGSFSRVFYSDNGSTSTEVALKMSVQYWWNKGVKTRTKILALTNSYHGDTFGAMSVSDRSVFTLAFHDKLFEVVFIDPPSTNGEWNTTGIAWEEVACFIYEPLIQGAGGMKVYDAAALNSLLKKCHQHTVVCIADEVMTGFGRTGKLFASEYVEEKPDIICLSKGLTGGTMALGVTACTDTIYTAFVEDDKLKTFFHGHSFTANPLACTAALASLDLLEQEQCRLQIRTIVQQHQRFLEQLQQLELPVKIKNLRQLGTILAFELELGKDEYLNNISTIISQQALGKGVYLRPLGNTIYIMPPYCVTAEQLGIIYHTIIALLTEITVNA
jgi:adenosylmethionine---8-amino-7-oxononanoate aminotransferase